MALITNQSKNELSGLGLFFKEIVQSRRFVGAAAPSGPILGKAMASKVPKLDEGEVVVELGAGTGAITRQLLKSGLEGHQLVSVERSNAMSEHLRKIFPEVTVLEGDACELRVLLKQHLGLGVDAVASIVSGLPCVPCQARWSMRLYRKCIRPFLLGGDSFNLPTISVHGPIRFYPPFVARKRVSFGLIFLQLAWMSTSEFERVHQPSISSGILSWNL